MDVYGYSNAVTGQDSTLRRFGDLVRELQYMIVDGQLEISVVEGAFLPCDRRQRS